MKPFQIITAEDKLDEVLAWLLGVKTFRQYTEKTIRLYPIIVSGGRNSGMPQFNDFEIDLDKKEAVMMSHLSPIKQAEGIINRLEFAKAAFSDDERNLEGAWGMSEEEEDIVYGINGVCFVCSVPVKKGDIVYAPFQDGEPFVLEHMWYEGLEENYVDPGIAAALIWCHMGISSTWMGDLMPRIERQLRLYEMYVGWLLSSFGMFVRYSLIICAFCSVTWRI